MKLIRKIFSWVVLIILLVLIGYIYTIRTVACDDSIKYVIGAVDPRFGISDSDLKVTINSATSVWEDALGKNLFEEDIEISKNRLGEFLEKYVDKYYVRKPIVISLIYDERQQIADQNRLLTSRIEDTKQTADEIKKEFLNLQKRYQQEKAEYENMMDGYRGGRINSRLINEKVDEVNRLADEINYLVKKYNYLVKEVNVDINKVNQNSGQEFEEGEYVSDRNGERISIYEFGDTKVLTRVLAHEFGHALGLDHNDNPRSIMYYLNKSSNMEPTVEDLAGISKVCKD